MKFCFSIKGWDQYSFDEFLDAANEQGFSAIELHDVRGKLFTAKEGAFHQYATRATLRKLRERKIEIPCIDAICNISNPNEFDEALLEIDHCLAVASNLHIPFLRLHAMDSPDRDLALENVGRLIGHILPEAEDMNIVLLLETSGLFSKTSDLRDILEAFASDNVAALWDFSAAYFGGGETPAEVIKNLGAYVKHIHINDACHVETEMADETEEGTVYGIKGIKYCLMGDGELPLADMMQALRSVNYDGYLSLVWNPSWFPELEDMDIIFSQFIHYMKQFRGTREGNSYLYRNRANTGTFVWKKELLVDKTFGEVLDVMCENYPDQYAFKYTTLDYTRTYLEFREDVDQFARSLIALGVRAGTHVAVWASNVPQWYIAFWATVKIGAVLVTVNTAYKVHELEYLLRQSDSQTLIMTAGNKENSYGEIVAELCPELNSMKAGEVLHAHRLPFLRNVITCGFRQKGCMTWEQALERSQEVSREEVRRMAAAVHKDDVANMQYTSGTTGFPKGVMLTHYNIVNNGKCIGDRMDLSTADRMMIQVPMFHCFGMVLAMTASMTHGATLLPLPYFNAKTSLACINNEQVTAFHGVPTMFISMLEHPDFEKTDFSYMRTGIMAGSPCPISTMKDVVEKMHMSEITIVYGQTEASPGCTMSSTDDPIEVRVNTVGRPLPEIECRIVDPETGEDLPDNVNGEFLARGYNIMKGYYKMPKETAEAIDRDGWLHTGDLACRTPEGNFRITGRLKDMIIRGGENIYPKEIEEFIYTNPKVSDVQVIGVPDENYGEEIMACVILKEGETMTEEEMKDFVKASMARHKVPRYVEFVDSFPMNAAGKIMKYKMREAAVEKLGLQKAAGVVTA